MKYKDIKPITRQEAEVAFSSGITPIICDALISITYHDSDWKWVQEKCIYYCKHSEPDIRGLAATCIGHLARIHGTLEMQPVLVCLNELLKDPQVSGRAQDALDDIEVYISEKLK